RLVFTRSLYNDTPTTEIYTLSLHDALPILQTHRHTQTCTHTHTQSHRKERRSEEHTSELQSHLNLVWRILLDIIEASNDLIRKANYCVYMSSDSSRTDAH